jgi:dTDP-4-dehydrorhamnose reductase
MDILLLGGTGQLGTELRALPLPSGVRITSPGRQELDLASDGAIAEGIASRPWSVVVNAAAYTAVDAAQTDAAAAFRANAVAPGRLAAETARRGIPLLHVSTDYVFDGLKAQPYRPEDPVNPINVYGASKEAGERAVRVNPRHVVLRTSWVYSPFGTNFVRTMLRLAATRDRLTVVDDQRGCPTAARDLAIACLAIAQRLAADPDRAPYGTYHCAGAGDATWCGFARAIFELAGNQLARVPEVAPITTAQYPTPALRAADTRLDCSGLAAFGLAMRDWRSALAETLARMHPQKEFA